MVITIYDKDNIEVLRVTPDDSSTQEQQVMGDNTLALSFTHYECKVLDTNSWCEFQGERYWLMGQYKPQMKGSHTWQYDVTLYGTQSLFKRFLVLETTDGDANAEFSLTGTAQEHAKLIVDSINTALGTTDFKVGEVDGTTENIVLDYEGTYCDDALKNLADALETEWWVDGQTINVCRCEHGSAISLGYGTGLTGIERQDADNASPYTRLFPMGSTRNMDSAKYGHQRLQLPDGKKYLEVNVDKYGIIDRYEKDAFANIYPRYTGTVASVRTTEGKNDDGTKYTIYWIKDSGITFNPDDYMLSGEVVRVSFQSGELNGLGNGDDHYFEVNWHEDSKEFEIITTWPYDDGEQLPGGTLVPKAGDTFMVWNIYMPQEFITAAEKELLEAAEEYNKKNAVDISVYKCATDHVYLEHLKDADGEAVTLTLGQKVRLESKQLFPDTGYRESRITRFSRKVNLPCSMDIEIGDALSTGSMQKMGDSVKAIGVEVRSLNFPDVVRSWEQTEPSDYNVPSFKTAVKRFLSRLGNDIAYGIITFAKDIIVKGIAILHLGWKTKSYDGDDSINGHGAMTDKDGNGVFQSLKARGFISAPKFVFNEIYVTKAEQWNTNAYGTIESVDTDKRQITLHLEDNEYGSVQVGDICRGIFADIDNGHGSDSNTEGDLDDCNFVIHKGFFTTYFAVEKIITNERGKSVFQYRKRSSATPDPCPYMDFAQYGNFIDTGRQSSMYMSSLGHSFVEVLDGVNNWEIQPQNRTARFGWLGDGKDKGLTVMIKEKDSDGNYTGNFLPRVLKGTGIFAQNNVYFGEAVIQLDNISDLDDLQKMAGAYDIKLSRYQGVITVDDQGNIIDGLYSLNSKKQKQWRLNTAVYVRKGTDILLYETDANEKVTEGHYRISAISEDCETMIKNGSVYITSIKNLRDGELETEEEINYDEMRKMNSCRVSIVVDLEGKTSQVIEFPVRIAHDSLPFMVCDINNEHSSVSYNTKTGKYTGFPVNIVATLMYHNEQWQIDSDSHVDNLPKGLKATIDFGTTENPTKTMQIKIEPDGTQTGDFLNTTGSEGIVNVTHNIAIHVGGTYAGRVYEYTRIHTLDRGCDVTVYELVPSEDSIIRQKDGTMSASTVSVKIFATSTDDKRYEVTDLATAGLTLLYGLGGKAATEKVNGNITIAGDETEIKLALVSSADNNIVYDTETIPVVAWGEDGKGVEFIYWRGDKNPGYPVTEEVIKSEEYQNGNYTDPNTGEKEYVPAGWNDNPVDPTYESPIEYVSVRKSVNGVWGKFSYPSVFAVYPKSILSTNSFYGVFANGFTPAADDSGFSYDTIDVEMLKSKYQGYYIWSVDEVTYDDKNRTKSRKNVSLIGCVDEINKVYEKYTVTDSVADEPTSTYSKSAWPYDTGEAVAAAATKENQAIWNCDCVQYTDATKCINIQCIGTVGKTGETPIASTTVRYSTVTNSASQPNDNTFTATSVPSLSKGSYLWCKEVTSFTYTKNTSLNTSSTRYWVSRVGSDGDTGKGIHIAYATSSDGKTGFKTTWFSGATYIGVCVNSDEADPTDYSKFEWSKIVGNGIKSTEIKYGRSASSSIIPTSWYDSATDSNVTPTDTYSWFWTRTIIYYTDGDDSGYQYSKSYKGKNGESITGPRGYRGPIIRKHADTDSEIASGFSYCQGLDSEEYVDFVYKTSEEIWCKCVKSYTAASAPDLTNRTYWNSVSTYKELATELLLAKNATVNMMNSQQFNLLDDDYKIFGSFRHVSAAEMYAFWLGGENGDDAAFGVTRGGSAHLDGTVTTGDKDGKHTTLSNGGMQVYGTDGKTVKTEHTGEDIISLSTLIPGASQSFTYDASKTYSATTTTIYLGGTNKNTTVMTSQKVNTTGTMQVTLSSAYLALIINQADSSKTSIYALGRITVYAKDETTGTTYGIYSTAVVASYNSTGKSTSQTIFSSVNIPVVSGHYYSITLRTDVQSLNTGESLTGGYYATSSVKLSSVTFKSDVYNSKFFGNGFMLSKDTMNYFAAMLEGSYMRFAMESQDYGIDVLNYLKFKKSTIWHKQPITLFAVKLHITSSKAEITTNGNNSGASLSVSRIDKGQIRITYPSTWSTYSLGTKGIAQVTPIRSTSGNTWLARVYLITDTYLDVMTSDDDTGNDDGYCFVELKVY